MTRRWLSLACARLEEACLGATSLNARFCRVDRACPAITLGFTTPLPGRGADRPAAEEETHRNRPRFRH